MTYQCNLNVAITRVQVNDEQEPDNYFIFIGERRYGLLDIIGALSEEERDHLCRAIQQVEEQLKAA